MEQVLNAAQIVLSIFTMIGLGMFLVKIGWIKDEHGTLISTLVTKVALPCMIISNIFNKFTRESLVESVVGIIIPFLSIIVTFLIGMLIAKLIRLPKRRRGVFVCMFTFSNSVFIGVPVSRALFGDEVIPYTLLYYLANTSLFWTAGHSLMSKDGGAAPKADLKAKLKRVLPIPLIFFIGSVLGLLIGLKPPKFMMDASGYVGNLVTPMSLFYTGLIIMRMIRAKHIRWQKGYELILLGRFLFAPVLLIGSVLLMNFIADASGAEALRAPELMRDALIIQAAMPVMSQTPIVAASCGSDEEFAAGGIAITTALSLVFIPLYMYIITAWM